MYDHILDLILISVDFHKGLVNEFGENSYDTDKLINAIVALGYKKPEVDSDGHILLESIGLTTDTFKVDAEDPLTVYKVGESSSESHGTAFERRKV
jgi:hypothetical protein